MYAVDCRLSREANGTRREGLETERLETKVQDKKRQKKLKMREEEQTVGETGGIIDTARRHAWDFSEKGNSRGQEGV